MEPQDIVGLHLEWVDMCNNRRGIVFNVRKPDRVQYMIGASGLSPIGLTMDVVWEDGLISKYCPVGRFRVLNKPRATDDEIVQALHDADQTRAKKEQEKAAAAAEDANIRNALPSLHPHLIVAKSKPDWNDGRVAAENIRRELKKAFPGTKFNVRFRTFSGGDSIDVSWVDGPATPRVNAIIGKYEYGHFDGMTDSYNHRKESERTWGDVFGSSKYVHASRSQTIDAVRKAWAAKGFDPNEVPATENNWQHQCWHHMMSAWSEMSF